MGAESNEGVAAHAFGHAGLACIVDLKGISRRACFYFWCLLRFGGGGGQGSIRMAVHRRRRGGVPPPPLDPHPRNQGDHRGKNEIYRWETLVGPFWYTSFLGPRPPPF